MPMIWKSGVIAHLAEYENEADLEAAVGEIASELFGNGRIYINVKKKIGAPGKQQNIPDGYLIDLSGREPKLHFVEIETQAHDPYRHVAVQILQFSISFELDRWRVKPILYNTLKADPKAWLQCEEFVRTRALNSVDHLLETMINKPFAAIVIIDEASELLETILTQKFKFGVEVLSVQRFVESATGERSYYFEPFLRDVRADLVPSTSTGRTSIPIDTADIDTIVVPAREDGFQHVFLGEDEWRSVRIHGSMLPQIKFVAAYRVAPIQAITHIAKVREILPSDDPGKWRLIFDGSAREIPHITLVPNGRVHAPQSIRYTTRQRLLEAKTLDDLWASDAL